MSQVELEELFHLYLSYYILTGDPEYRSKAEKLMKQMRGQG